MANIFQRIQVERPKYSAFDLSHERKLSLQMGKLYPILHEDVVPGDKFRVNTEVMLRMAPMIAPIMHRVNVFIHYFFVPNRLVWDEWEKFITGGDDGTENPTFPTFALTSDDGLEIGSLADHFGIPTVQTAGPFPQYTMSISALPFYGYNLIWSEYYRDQQLQNPWDPITESAWTDVNQIRTRAWEKDYFTSALPNPQKGPPITVPLNLNYLPQSEVYQSDGSTPSQNTPLRTDSAPFADRLENNTNEPLRIENLDSSTEQIPVSEFRQAFKLQEWWELMSRAGSRYIEQIQAHFGVRSSDARLQRPEYLGGGVQPVMISEVLNTAGDPGGSNSAVGDMAGHGVSIGNQNKFTRRFEEHGQIFGIMSVLPKTAYQQGIHRKWKKFDRFDYYWPKLAHIGEQAILNEEIYVDPPNDAAQINFETFGYQERYSEYKYACSTVHGDFRDTLNFWHMGRIFASRPSLNEDFIESDPTNRIFAVQTVPPGASGDNLWCQLYNKVEAIRPMPYFTNPSLM